MDKGRNERSWSIDGVFHIGLAAVLFVSVVGFSVWPDLQAVLS